jgi:hypothetical protein
MCQVASELVRNGDGQSELRVFDRLQLRCPVRIRIENRHYAAYLENISEGGAKIRTLSPITDAGKVQLTIPDMPLLRGELRWTGIYEAGLRFATLEYATEVQRWARERTRTR